MALPTTDQVREALKQWHSANTTESPLAMLHQFRKMHRETGYSLRDTANHILLAALELLRQRYPPDAQFLQLRIVERWTVRQLAQYYSVADNMIYTMQREAIERLAEILRDQEAQAALEQRERLWRRLDATAYGTLVGLEPHIEQLLVQLREARVPWIVTIEGLGGIGKTTLADVLMRHLIEQDAFAEIGWVSAQQNRLNLGGAITVVAQPALTVASLVETLVRQLLPELSHATMLRSDDLLPRLRTLLKQTPHLIVIDNLETLVDIESLLPTLQDLANPSKFLLTSRHALATIPSIYHFTVPELREEHALQLIRQEATMRNLPVLAAAANHELRPIYATVGGNPLALRLVVGQTHIYTLSSILEHLQKARGEAAESLYTYIYRRSWEGLDATSQDVLLIMPLVNPNGDDIKTIAEVGDLAPAVLQNALDRLVKLNLVDAYSTATGWRYRIHGLTRTFLHEQVLHWQM